jgi:effector-binding domain-containing protein
MRKQWTIFAALMMCVSLAFAQISVQVEPQAQKPDTQAQQVSQAPAAARCEIVGKIEVQTFPAATVAGVMEKAADYLPEGGYAEGEAGMSLAYEKMMIAGFAKLSAWMTAGGQPMGPPFAVFYEDPEKTPAKNLTCKLAFPTAADAAAKPPVVVEPMPEYTALLCTYKGPYEGSGEIWKTCDKWVTDNGYVCSGPPLEVYIRGQEAKILPSEYITEIRIPVKKAEAKPKEGGK